MTDAFGADASTTEAVSTPVTGTGPLDTGPLDTTVLGTGPLDTTVLGTGPLDTTVLDAAVLDTTVLDTGALSTAPVLDGAAALGSPGHLSLADQRAVLEHCSGQLSTAGPFSAARQRTLLTQAGSIAATSASRAAAVGMVDERLRLAREAERDEIDAVSRQTNWRRAALAQLTQLGVNAAGVVAEFCATFAGVDGLPYGTRGLVESVRDDLTAADVDNAIPVGLLAAMLGDDAFEALSDIKIHLFGRLLRVSGFGQHLPPVVAPERRLHFFWAGRAMSPAAVANVSAWGNAAKQAGNWTVTLWTDHELTQWRPEVMQPLLLAGIGIKDAYWKGVQTPLWQGVEPRLRPGYELARGVNWPAASDMVRLSALYAEGGAYCDVDIAPGDFDFQAGLPRARFMMPRLAPGIRDEESVRFIVGKRPGGRVSAADVRAAADQLRFEGSFNNNFIVCARASVFLDVIINAVARNMSEDLEKVNSAFTSNQVVGLTGWQVIKGALDIAVPALAGVSNNVGRYLVDRDVVTELRLGWLTGESEDTRHL